MRRGAMGIRLALAAAAVVLTGAAVAQAQPALTISDATRIEGDAGTTLVMLNVVLAGPNLTGVTFNYATVDGSATAGSGDYLAIPTTPLSIPSPFTSATISVYINGDTNPEWNPTLQQDEVFFVDLSSPVNATIQKGRATVTILDDDHSNGGLQFLSAISDGTATAGRNRLQWRVPPAPVAPTNIAIRWNVGFGCTTPVSTTDGTGTFVTPLGPGQKQQWDHNSLSLLPYCYALFAMYGATPTTEVATVKARPFDVAASPLKWSYSPGCYAPCGAATVVPPTVGQDAVYTVGTDGVVHAMQRGTVASAGLWPPSWNPVALGKPAHNRSPVVPQPAGWRLFVGTENGEVHAVDAKTGAIVWSRSAAFGNTQLMTNSTGTQATPAGLFKTFGGQNDMILVGTANSTSNTRFFALNPANGSTIDYYPNGPIGPGDSPPGPIDNVYGMAVVDYASNRVFFGTAGASFTLWSLDLGPIGSPNLTLSPIAWNPKPLGLAGGTSGSPVFRNGRLYLGTDTGAAAAVHSLRVSDGNLYSYTHGDGEAKGFLWPDRRDDRLYFSTTSRVHGVRDNGTALVPLPWSPVTLTNPSIVLQKPGSDYLYVGEGNGRLYQIDAVTGALVFLVLEAGFPMGAPSLDNANDLVLVGSATGTIYAVQVPF